MNSSILTTKLFIPPVRPDLMPRPHLIKKLNESTRYPVTLISASAGSGKTTILSEWAANADRPVAWVSLEPDDNDPAQFLMYFISALRTFQTEFGQETINLLTSSQSDALEMVLINLINEIVELPGNFTVILDDYHTITNTKINDLVTLMIEHLPPQVHLVFASRIDPAWPLARYRSRNQIYEIRGHDLQFNEQEAANFLNRSMGLDLSADQVIALEERTEGWIAGLQLAAISMQRQEDISKFIKEFTGSHLYVAEYLIEEILNQQSEEIQSFLVKSSILDRLNAELCEAISESHNGQAILNFLYKANIFLVPLDNQGEWFRYHHLFADLLRSRLQQTYTEEQIAELHSRASDWFESNQLAVEAVQHTLAAKKPEKAAFLVNKHGQAIFFSERYNILKNWLNAIPDEYLQKYPRLEIYRLLIDLLEGTLDMYEKTLAEKEVLIKALPQSPENDRLRRRALVNLSLFYAFQNTRKAIQIAEETLEEIPEDDLHMRAYLYSSFYRAYGMEGNVDKASTAYRESFRLANITNQFEMISNTTKIRTFDLCQYGKLDEAAEYCQRIIDIGSSQKIKVFYPAGPCYVGLAGIHLERNDLEKAEEYLHIGLELCHQGAKYGLFTGYVQKIRLLQAKGQLEEALNELQIFEQTFQRREFTFLAQKVSLLLAANELEKASEMVPYLQELLGASYYAKDLPLIAREFFMFCLARIYLGQGELDKVFPLLDEIQTTVEPDKRFGRLMEVYLLRALAKNKQEAEKIPPEGIADLEKALELAIKPGFVMLFLEEGPALIPLLQAVINHQKASHEVRQYAQKLLQAFAEAGQLPAEAAVPAVHQLVEQLTPRELEVLQMVATGASNREIADKLVITIRTVKKHTSNIYGKLNVGSRTQAVAYAREIGLLPID